MDRQDWEWLVATFFIAVSVAYLLGVFVFWGIRGLKWVWNKLKGLRRGKYPMSEERQVCDAIVSVLENLIHRKVISPERAQYWYERIGKGAGLPGIMPAKLRGEELKKAIRQRLHSFHGVDVYKPVPLPDRRRSLKDIFEQAPPWKESAKCTRR